MHHDAHSKRSLSGACRSNSELDRDFVYDVGRWRAALTWPATAKGMGGACVGAEIRRGRIAGIVGLLALAAILVLSWMLERPPTPVPASAPAPVFSAQRAYAELQQIAGPEPTPIGSTGSDAVRDHIAAALSAAGFSVEMHTGVGSRTFHSTTVAGRVQNVVARWPGYDSTGQVLL
ncbi:MAG TPA: hypothetical protein VNC13_01965, partial [Propionibacteriaceae bacterium]|nr:hypothetical protein [Propionibacteriaceae bacterium]